ncbi:MAG: hypothetical protein WBC70_12180 [Candidatus Aminicenantales bacterium]
MSGESVFQKGALLFVITLILGLWILGGQEDRGQIKDMGYCFDAAYHSGQERLFVVGGIKGLHVFKANGGRLDFVTTVYDEGYYRNIDIAQDRAFIADSRRGLIVMDISGENPVVTWRWKDPEPKTPGMGIHVDGSHAYLAVGNADKYEKAGIYIFDISNRDRPELTGYARTKNAWDIWTKDAYAYVADMSEGLTVLDISQSSSPRTIGNAKWDDANSMAEIIRGEGNKVYIAAGKHGLIIADIRDPHNPRVEGTFQSGPQGFAEGLCVRDEIVYLANAHDLLTRENGLFVIDAGDPKKPRLLGKCTFQGWVEGVSLDDKYVFVTNTYSGVRSVDVSEPAHPRLIDSYGPAKSKPSIAEKILVTLEENGLETALAVYEDLSEKARDAYEFGEEELNRLGYYLLKTQKVDDAIAIFKLNQEVYPQSYNAYDSLGDAYLHKAYWSYKKSLDLNPENEHAKAMIQRIMGKS